MRRLARWTVFYAVLTITLAVFMFVFVWLVLSAFKSNVDIYAIPPKWLFTPTLTHFRNVTGEIPFIQYIGNSIVVGTVSTTAALLLALPAAYSIARYRQRRLAEALLISRIIPGIIYLVPFFLFFQYLGLLRTYVSLIVTHLLLTFPMSTWILIPFFEDLPNEIEEAALIDGCSKTRTFVQIAVPLVKPGIAVAAILSFITSWNDYIFALILSGSDTRTVPVALLTFMGQSVVDWGGMSAAAVMATTPVIAMAVMVQRHMVKGLTLGGLK